MRKTLPRWAAPWIVALGVRLALGAFVRCPTVLRDEAEYFLAARQPPGHPGILAIAYPPLYPAFIALGARAGEVPHAYLACRLLNAAVSSTIVPLTFPLWQAAGPWAGVAVGLAPFGVITSGLLLSENLFGPLSASWLLAAIRWRKRRSGRAALALALLASLGTLTRAAGAALILATVWEVVGTAPRRLPTCLAGLVPMLVYLAVRLSHPVPPFNDPLAVTHPPEIARALGPDLGNLTVGTPLAPLTSWVRTPVPFVLAWFSYWSLQHVLYLVVATWGLSLAAVVGGRGRERALPPLLRATILTVLLAANHCLDGVQAHQFVRGRYVEPLVPLWCAVGLGMLAGTDRVRLPWGLIGLGGVAGFVGLAAPQNRAADFLYPVRSFLLRIDSAHRALPGACCGLLCMAVLLLLLRRVRLRLLVPAFVAISLAASLARFHLQHTEALGQAVPARWLAAHDPTATVEIQTRGLPVDSLKASGLFWAAQQVRFFSRNPLALAPEPAASYRLVVDGGGLACGALGKRRAVCLRTRD